MPAWPELKAANSDAMQERRQMWRSLSREVRQKPPLTIEHVIRLRIIINFLEVIVAELNRMRQGLRPDIIKDALQRRSELERLKRIALAKLPARRGVARKCNRNVERTIARSTHFHEHALHP